MTERARAALKGYFRDDNFTIDAWGRAFDAMSNDEWAWVDHQMRRIEDNPNALKVYFER